MSDENAETGLAEAERRIAACRAAHSEVLDLSGLQLRAVPESLGELTWLKQLDLSRNQIGDDGARALAALTGLTSLDLGGNGTIDLRPLASLQKLEQISLNNCKIADTCLEFWFLPSLRTVNLEGATLGDVPRELLGRTALNPCARICATFNPVLRRSLGSNS